MRNNAYIILIVLGAIILGTVMTGVAWAFALPHSLNGIIFFTGVAIIEIAIVVLTIVLLITLIRKIFK